MGNCASSKRIEASVASGAYRPALDFDINNIQEPWRTAQQDEDEDEEDVEDEMKKVASSPVALDKLNRSLEADQEAPPPTWEQVKKDLEFIKPTIQPTIQKPTAVMPSKPTSPVAPLPPKKIKRKSFSFHTLEELDTRRPLPESASVSSGLRKIESMNDVSGLSSVKAGLRKTNSVKQGGNSRPESTGIDSEGFKPVRQNIFLLKDRMERQKEGKEGGFLRRDPLSDYPELCPPGGADLVVVYTTSLGGVRRTYEDCYKVRSILELHRVVFDERDVSLHGDFLSELKELVGEGAGVPRLFVKGRYIGGVDEVVNLNETGKLRRIWNWVGVERGSGRQGCEGCGGARFVPCLDCGGSCRVVVVVEGKTQKQKCPECNENGLMHCPACL
ncbi:hypothetical protein DCAR_0934520 [Daucus carota subsp. sativus]|uniref:Glutaredoxin domain-containing protein n=1 Tax=Daucus carota subsp. sativus TaxID=79200 RepID=A0A175YGE6_DAUCS|nr:PREDICTED: glutaredoxin domain-containing cysteine-rich protein 1 [Daucus carota subsp. sativus]WOH14990.1 hypothetical protein DCAR_0934520 [Daucus carota subsp. sativus]